MTDLREMIQASLNRAEQARSPEAVAKRNREKHLAIARNTLATIERNIEIARHNIKLSGEMLGRDAVQNDIGAYWFWLESAFVSDRRLNDAYNAIASFASFYPELEAECTALCARIEAE